MKIKKKKRLCKKISPCVARLNPRNKKWVSDINYGKLPCAGPAFVAFPWSILEEASSKEKKKGTTQHS